MMLKFLHFFVNGRHRSAELVDVKESKTIHVILIYIIKFKPTKLCFKLNYMSFDITATV